MNVRLTRLQGDAASFHPYAVPVDAGFHSYTNDVARACESCQAVVRAKTADAALKFICLAALLTCWAVQQIAARALRMDAS